MKVTLLVLVSVLSLVNLCKADVTSVGLQIKFVATQAIVPGEPIFVGYDARENSDTASMPLALDLKSDFRAGVSVHISSLSSTPLLALTVGGRANADQLSRVRIQPINSEYRDLLLVDVDTSKLLPGSYRLSVTMNTTAGTQSLNPAERFESGSERAIQTNATFTLTVGDRSEEKLLEAAYRMVRYMNDVPGASLSSAVPNNYGSMETDIQGLESMPVVPCGQAWRELLMTERFPRKGYAATVLANKKGPEYKHLLLDLLEFVESHRDHAGVAPANLKGLADRDVDDIRSIKDAIRVQSGELGRGRALN